LSIEECQINKKKKNKKKKKKVLNSPESCQNPAPLPPSPPPFAPLYLSVSTSGI